MGKAFLTCALLSLSGQLLASTITHSISSTFNASSTGLTGLDFESANVSDGTTAIFAGPLDSTTNNGIFSTGDVPIGIAFSEPATGDLEVIGKNTTTGGGTLNTKHLTFLDCSSGLRIDLTGTVSAIGFDLFATEVDQTIDVSVFDGVTLLHTETMNFTGSAPLSFIGFTSTTDSFTHVTLDSQDDLYYSVDNVSFGQAVPEPHSLALGAVGAGLLFLVLALRRVKLRS